MPGALSYLIEKVEGLEKTAQSLLNRQEECYLPHWMDVDDLCNYIGLYKMLRYIIRIHCLPLLKCAHITVSKCFNSNIASIFLLPSFYFASTLLLLIIFKPEEGVTLSLSDSKFRISFRWKKCSHSGNVAFPVWEHDIPTLGISSKPKVCCLSR